MDLEDLVISIMGIRDWDLYWAYKFGEIPMHCNNVDIIVRPVKKLNFGQERTYQGYGRI